MSNYRGSFHNYMERNSKMYIKMIRLVFDKSLDQTVDICIRVGIPHSHIFFSLFRLDKELGNAYKL